jgi:hypothetical protein
VNKPRFAYQFGCLSIPGSRFLMRVVPNERADSGALDGAEIVASFACQKQGSRLQGHDENIEENRSTAQFPRFLR